VKVFLIIFNESYGCFVICLKSAIVIIGALFKKILNAAIIRPHSIFFSAISTTFLKTADL